MKKIIFAFLVTSISTCWAQEPANIPEPQDKKAIIYDATTDFQVINAGDAPYYIDKRNDALGIDARNTEYRSLYARANRLFSGKSGIYDVTIQTLTEEDGESNYQLLINNKLVATYRNTYIGKGSDRDLKAENHTWTGITIAEGDQISVASVAHTNGEIPENNGTAWARGRWQQIEFSPASNKQYPKAAFNKHHDLFIAQFDSKPDADDIHAIAALGSLLAHEDSEHINYVAVDGAVGTQGGDYIEASNLFTLAFGQENVTWTSAHKDWKKSVSFIHDRVLQVLSLGGKAWVQEAGQSDFTRDWVNALIESGVSKTLIKNNVIVVQHSQWNEDKTSPDALEFVKQHTDYQAINDGNKPLEIFKRRGRRGPFTPMYVDDDSKWIESAISLNNSKIHARQLWQEAAKVIDKSGFNAKYSSIPKGGVDFSDTVEAWWILDLGQPSISVHAFWQRYVTSVELDSVTPPNGRLAIVIDGNSPDPDDIGATPVMFGLLQQTQLADRLVHVSHSCDLDPFKNKGHQIDPVNEARRQEMLHMLTGKSINLFGPFKNLRDFYNCREDQQGATQDLTDAINASTAEDPLWIIEAGEPDLIGYALALSDPTVRQFVHVVSHHPANDNSGDYFTWQQILDFGVIEHQIGDQNLGLQTPMTPWDWAKDHHDPGIAFIWEMLAYAEQDGIVPFQTNKFDCSDAGMVYWWITGANHGGNKASTASDIKDMLLLKHPK
ncbi:hypothetical protein ACFL6Z_11000 [Pseudomonadota bacterium]